MAKPIKKSMTFEEIEKSIETCLDHQFKYFIPHWMYVSTEVRMELIEKGYKLSTGPGFGNEESLIIEW